MHEVSGPLARSVVDILRAEQKARDWSDTEVALVLDVSQQAWNLVRRGKRGLTLEMLSRIVDSGEFPKAQTDTISFFARLGDRSARIA